MNPTSGSPNVTRAACVPDVQDSYEPADKLAPEWAAVLQDLHSSDPAADSGLANLQLVPAGNMTTATILVRRAMPAAAWV